MKVTEHDSRFGAIVMGIMGFIVLKGGEFVGYGLMLLAVALIWYALGIKYKVMLITSSGELSAVEGRDKDQISRVVNALNSAIIARS